PARCPPPATPPARPRPCPPRPSHARYAEMIEDGQGDWDESGLRRCPGALPTERSDRGAARSTGGRPVRGRVGESWGRGRRSGAAFGDGERAMNLSVGQAWAVLVVA